MAEPERYGEHGVQLSYTGRDRSGVEAGSAKAAASMATTKGKNLGSISASAEGMPKQEPGEDAAAFGERMRVYREKKRTSAQKDAIRRMP